MMAIANDKKSLKVALKKAGHVKIFALSAFRGSDMNYRILHL